MALLMRSCFLCGAPLQDEPFACEDCARSLRRVDREVLRLAALSAFCDTLTVPVYYEGALREAMLRYKFHGHGELYRALAACILAVLPDRGFDCVTFAPLPRSRENRRGYNQAALIAKAVARRLALPCRELLMRAGQNAEQHTLSAAERAENVQHAYRAKDPEKIRGKRILLIDDIVTTGHTLAAMANCLRDAGAAEIHGAAAAYTPHQNRETGTQK